MGLLDVYGDGLHQRVIDAILPAFDYLENRLTGQCQAQFDCTHSYAICRVLRLFGPSYVAEHEATADSASVRKLSRGASGRAFVHAELGSSGARAFAPQGALQIQPGHGPRRLHPKAHDGPLQRLEARDLVLRRKAREGGRYVGELNTRHRAHIRAQEISKFQRNFEISANFLRNFAPFPAK